MYVEYKNMFCSVREDVCRRYRNVYVVQKSFSDPIVSSHNKHVAISSANIFSDTIEHIPYCLCRTYSFVYRMSCRTYSFVSVASL